MRVHKFSAQLVDGGEWLEFELLINKIGNQFDDGVFYVDGLALNAKTLSECTGLKDKKMIDVYEGSIGRFMDKGQEVIGYVRYHDGDWIVDPRSVNSSHWLPKRYVLSEIFQGRYEDSTKGHPFEVVGHICVNPELLK